MRASDRIWPSGALCALERGISSRDAVITPSRSPANLSGRLRVNSCPRSSVILRCTIDCFGRTGFSRSASPCSSSSGHSARAAVSTPRWSSSSDVHTSIRSDASGSSPFRSLACASFHRCTSSRLTRPCAAHWSSRRPTRSSASSVAIGPILIRPRHFCPRGSIASHTRMRSSRVSASVPNDARQAPSRSMYAWCLRATSPDFVCPSAKWMVETYVSSLRSTVTRPPPGQPFQRPCRSATSCTIACFGARSHARRRCALDPAAAAAGAM